MVKTSNSASKSAAKANNGNGKTVAKSGSKSERSPNIRGVETKVRAIIDPIIKSNKTCKVITLLNKLLLEYTTVEKEQKAQSILNKAIARRRMIGLRAEKRIADIYNDCTTTMVSSSRPP